MAAYGDLVDLSGLHLSSGQGRRLELELKIDPFELGGERYTVPGRTPAGLDVSRTTGDGYALRLRFAAELDGPCMRCLAPAAPQFTIDAREVSQPGAGEELASPYVSETVPTELDARAWAHDALALVLPAQVLCRPDCAGLCAVCGVDLNQAGPEHSHPAEPDPRWAKLSELKFD